VPASQICIKAIMTQLLGLNVADLFERITYFLKKRRVLFVALFSKMLALEAADQLASPLGPDQTCAARRHYVTMLKFQIELKDHKSLRTVTCTI
jgi:hypothetical protein